MTSLDPNTWKFLLSASAQRFPTISLNASAQAPLDNYISEKVRFNLKQHLEEASLGAQW